MHRPLGSLALAAVLVVPALHVHAQQPTFDDPANLTGERIKPRTGRELPIDGGEGNNALGLAQMLRRLQTRASILNIVAHPDDEDGGMLTLYARGMGARVGDLALTRGEGGQNAMTGDFEDALGLLRTQELLANDRYTGVDQMFGTEVDFGFSKTKSEAFAKWPHERCLYDAVRAIRLYRPLVITATFIGNPTDGHGQHQVSGEIAQEAFIAAGDPNVFPELTKEGILPWQPLKMYARVPRGAISAQGLFDYATGQYVPAEFTNYITHVTTKTPPATDVVVHEGTRDPLLTSAAAHASDLGTVGGDTMSYVQFARIGLGLQKSQIGPGVRMAPVGTFDVDYHRYGSKLETQPEIEQNFFDGVDTSLLGIQALAPDAFPTDLLANATRALRAANDTFDPAHPEAIAPLLEMARSRFDQLIKAVQDLKNDSLEQRESALHELRIKRAQANEALALALGLTLDATTPANQSITARNAVSVTAKVAAPADSHCVLGDVSVQNATGAVAAGKQMEGDQSDGTPGALVRSITISNPADPFDTAFTASITKPYFRRDNIEQPTYTLVNAPLRNAPQSPPAFTVNANVSCSGIIANLLRVVHVPEKNTQPIQIVPNLNVALLPPATVLPKDVHNITLRVLDHSFSSRAYVTGLCIGARCVAPPRPDAEGSATVNLAIPEQTGGRAFIVTTTGFSGDERKRTVTDPEGFRPVGYGDLPITNYYTVATTRVVPVDLKLPTKRRIAYLPGTGDAVPEALASIGLSVATLGVSDLDPSTLAQYDTVILGVRTYNAHPDLHGAPTQALLDFARNGGNVIVQYQTGEFSAEDAPYALSLGSEEKVVDETAPVELLDPANPLLTSPNRITPADFNGWIEERGHGFMGTWDSHYTALTETGDPGSPAEHVAPQKPQRGGLVTAAVGKGRWTYVSFALYRQLPEAVPGAYRLMMNLLDAH